MEENENNKTKIGKGLRFNSNKLRYDLIHPEAEKGMVQVMTKGAQKYAERNWELGMSWTTVIASLKRHMAAIERGEDYDPETGELHIDHVQCNAHFLSAYYRIFPQGDDRPHNYLSRPKIGLDIDEVICDFVGGCIERFPEMQDRSVFWNDHNIDRNWNSIKDDKDFWMNLKPRISHDDLGFEPHCYITSRTVPTELTKAWLDMHGFPSVPIYTVGFNESKVEVAKTSGIDIFVDDRFENFVELNRAGICCFLFDAPHNHRYDVGYKRLFNLKDLVK
jgi:hypothetical protein